MNNSRRERKLVCYSPFTVRCSMEQQRQPANQPPLRTHKISTKNKTTQRIRTYVFFSLLPFIVYNGSIMQGLAERPDQGIQKKSQGRDKGALRIRKKTTQIHFNVNSTSSFFVFISRLISFNWPRERIRIIENRISFHLNN